MRIFLWILIAILIAMLAWCWKKCKDTPPPPDPNPHLILEGDGAAAFLHIKNSFETDSAFGDRVGILFQLGDPSTGKWQLAGVELRKGGSVVKSYPRTALFDWMNVVFDPSLGDVMKEDSAFGLYDGPAPCVNCCDIDADPMCLRNKTIHARFTGEVYAIVTAWEGRNGYESSVSLVDTEADENRYEFTFGDETFQVDVYDAEEVDGTWAMKSIDSFTQDDVDQIVIQVVNRGPTGGDTQQPPWLFP